VTFTFLSLPPPDERAFVPGGGAASLSSPFFTVFPFLSGAERPFFADGSSSSPPFSARSHPHGHPSFLPSPLYLFFFLRLSCPKQATPFPISFMPWWREKVSSPLFALLSPREQIRAFFLLFLTIPFPLEIRTFKKEPPPSGLLP